jgi:hypothetical protein
MGQAVIQQFTIVVDESGIQKITAGLKTVESQSQVTGNAMATSFSKASVNFDGLARRVERPLAAVAYSGVANDLVDMGKKGENAMVMMEHGLHSVGNAMMFFNPLLGLAVIAGVALFEVFQKMANMNKANAEEIKNQANALDNEKKALDDALPYLIQHGLATKEDADAVKDLSKATQASINKIIDAAKARLEAARAAVKEAEAYQVLNHYTKEDISVKYVQKKAADEYAAALKSLTGLTEHFVKIKPPPPPDFNDSVYAKKHELQLQTYVDAMKLGEAEKQLAADQKLVADIENAILETTDRKELEMWNEKLTAMQKITDAEAKRVGDLKQKATQEGVVLKNMEAAWFTYAQNIGDALGKGKLNAKQMAEDMMKDQLKILGDGLIKQLTAKATANMADPFTVGIALAEIAAISAVESILGVSGGGEASSSSSAASSPTQPQQVTNVNVMFQGGSLSDPGAIAVIMKGITKQVSQNNGQVIVTNVAGKGAIAPGVLG